MKEIIHQLPVHILKSTGTPALDCTATIYVELPDSYDLEAGRSYPVCYALDGELISRENDSVGLHALYASQTNMPEVIYVGISLPLTGATRTSALGAPIHSTFFLVDQTRGDIFHLEGKGDYLFAWVANELKPYIDGIYRTKKTASDTGIMGWSSGGSGAIFAAMLEYETFTRVGSFSPATWVWDTWFYGAAENTGYVYDYTSEDGAQRRYTTSVDHITRLFMYQGGEDGSAGDAVWAMNSAKTAYDTLLRHGAGSNGHSFLFRQEGTHSAEAWRPFLAACICTMFSDDTIEKGESKEVANG